MSCRTWVERLVVSFSFATSLLTFPEGSAAQDYRDFHITLPLVSLTADSIFRVEYNLGGHASLALEGAAIQKLEQLSEDEVKEKGDSLLTEGQSLSLIVSRFTRPETMSGVFWSLGAGYRTLRTTWSATPDRADPEADFSLANDEGRFDHELEVGGVTGHARIGYRYVPDWPLLVGIYLGIRHFQSGVRDLAAKDAELLADPVTERQAATLRRRFMTKLEPGLEFGLSF